MSKKKLAFIVFNLLFLLGIMCIFCKLSRSIAIALLVFYVLVGVCGVLLLKINSLYMRTNHWKNFTSHEKQFISNVGYRENLNRNFDIVNLGSNPARYGFFYENVRGQNWATGSQGLEMDYEILKYYHSYIKEGGYVLIPIMPFTSVSQYLTTKPEVWSDEYYMKFARILDKVQTLSMPRGKIVYWKSKYPLLFNVKKLIYLLSDVNRDERLYEPEQRMSKLELEQDSSKWMEMWVDEFDAKCIKDFMGNRYDVYVKDAEKILGEMIDFCLYRNLKPILITVPMSSSLQDKFSEELRKKLIYDFIENSNIMNVPFLDYMFDNRFSDGSLYNGAFFLNLKGRKCFTNQVVKDLGLYRE